MATGKAGVRPGRAVVFEDAPVSIQAAKAAGMLAVGVGTTHPIETLRAASADHAVKDLVGFPVGPLVGELSTR